MSSFTEDQIQQLEKQVYAEKDIAQFRQRSRKIEIVYPHHFLCRLSSSRQDDRYYVIHNQQKLESLLKAYLDYGDPQFRAEYDRLIARHWSRSRAIHHPDILDLVVGYFCSREKEIFQHRRRKQMMKSMPEPPPPRHLYTMHQLQSMPHTQEQFKKRSRQCLLGRKSENIIFSDNQEDFNLFLLLLYYSILRHNKITNKTPFLFKWCQLFKKKQIRNLKNDFQMHIVNVSLPIVMQQFLDLYYPSGILS